MSTRRPTPSWRTGVLGGVLAAGLLACGVPDDRTAALVADDDVPFDLLSPTTTALTDVVDGRETTVCLAVDNVLLSLGRDRSGDDLADDLALVTDPPTEGEAALGVRSALEGDESVLDVSRVGSEAVVELGVDFPELPADQQLLAVAQITCTLTAQPGVQRVSFELEGRTLSVPVQGGELVDRPVVRSDYVDFFAN